MKKRLHMVVMFLILLLCVSCGKENSQTDVKPTEQITSVTPELTPEPSATPTPTEKPTPTVKPTPTEKPTPTPIAFDIGLKDLYQDNFPIGVAVNSGNVVNNSLMKNVIANYNSITCENEMKPDALLDGDACRADLENTYTNPAVKFNSCKRIIQFALENDMKIRLHTLVWHAQTPKWFFTEDYTNNGELVSREVMLLRMENYIKNVLTYFDENYPGLIYAVDVCNEAFDGGNGDENGIRKVDNFWYDTVGADYYYQAFVFARKHAPEYMKLFYNDYGCMSKFSEIIKHLAQAKEEGLIDGIGMQSHLSTSDNIQYKFMNAVKKFCEAGYAVQITELDIGISEVNDYNLAAQGRKYKLLFGGLKALQEEGYNITGVTVWGVNDNNSWRAKDFPLLFDKKNQPKPAYAGAMLAEDIFAVD